MSRRVCNIDWGVPGASSEKNGPTQSVRRTEMLVLAHVHAGGQPLPNRYGEGQGRLSDPVSAVGPTHPWPTPCNTHGSVTGEQ